MTQVESPLSIIKGWQNKSLEFNTQSKDRLLPLMTKTFETMSDLLSGEFDREDVLLALLNLDSQRANTMRFESKNTDAIRTLVFGLIQSLQLILLDLTEKGSSSEIPSKCSTMDECTQTEVNDEDSSGTSYFPLPSSSADSDCNQVPPFTILIPKEENIETINFNYNEANNFQINDYAQFKDEEPTTSSMVNRANDSYEDEDLNEEMTLDEEDQAEEEGMDQEWNINDQTVAKTSKERISSKKMMCPELGCNFFSYYAKKLISHLRVKHDTTLKLANATLKCECGHLCLSSLHGERCRLANFEVIRTGGGPVRRLSDVKMITVRCFVGKCEKYSKSPDIYCKHLERAHSTSLIKEGYFLLCECGGRITSVKVARKHECQLARFSLRKL
ncbi:hypothetical protein PMAYCL1PPCAC_07862 [Pristionchus mayeri]|uniref:Uncharacterized protein n=1 Tax=Pristionchus mayeri TaxID=1317129 RepID=A0AAN5CC04_9BILA|nr:hypothetical protein PMAYCL1PPCAC_07862 [Pristionchus mayeri]